MISFETKCRLSTLLPPTILGGSQCPNDKPLGVLALLTKASLCTSLLHCVNKLKGKLDPNWSGIKEIVSNLREFEGLFERQQTMASLARLLDKLQGLTCNNPTPLALYCSFLCQLITCNNFLLVFLPLEDLTTAEVELVQSYGAWHPLSQEVAPHIFQTYPVLLIELSPSRWQVDLLTNTALDVVPAVLQGPDLIP